MEKILNSEQLAVINELKNNVFLVASAGTGKTETLSQRLANIINNKKAEGKEILCITFTNKACKEMQERIEKIVGKEAKDITVKTFHSFSLQVIKEQSKKKTDIFTDFTVIDEEDSKEIIKKFNNKEYPVNALYSFVCLIKEYRIKLNILSENSYDDYNKVIDYLFKNKNDSIDNICTVGAGYERRLNIELKNSLRKYGYMLINKYDFELKKNHMLDFNDLITETKKLFEDKEVVDQYKNQYKYINIDEVQDTSITEYKIIEKIFENNNILLCGDRFQTIYEWRGSVPTEIQEAYQKKYLPKVIQFCENYRATKVLTDSSIEYLKKTFPNEYKSIYDLDIKSISENEGEKILYNSYSNRRQEAENIKNYIEEIYRKNNKPGRICILTRNNMLNVDLSECLKNDSEKYEFALVDQYKFFRREEIKDIVAFLKLIVNENDAISFERILKKFPTGVRIKKIEEIQSDYYKQIGIKLTDFIKDNTNGEYFSLLLDIYESNGTIIVFDVESTGTDVTEDEIIQIAAIKIDKEGDVIDSFERFIKPSKSVGSSALVHNFTDEFLNKNGQDKETAFKDFIEFSKNALIIGHNVKYDISILSSELERCGIEQVRFKGVYDTLDIYRRFYPNLVNHKLETLSKLFPIKHSPSHNALDDVKATAYLLVYAINNKIKETSLERISCVGKHIKSFVDISNSINRLFEDSLNMRPDEIVEYILENFSFEKIYAQDEREKKFKRIKDFKNFLKLFDKKEKRNRDSLIDIVNITALSNGEIEEIMIKRTGKDRIPIITVHQAKGLEFDYVFLAGLEENTFPSYQSIKNGNVNEEKRLFYVAITRAKKKLYLSNVTTNKWGKEAYPSKFIFNISNKYIL